MFTDLQIVIMYKDDLIQNARPKKGGLICLQIYDLIHYVRPRKGDLICL